MLVRSTQVGPEIQIRGGGWTRTDDGRCQRHIRAGMRFAIDIGTERGAHGDAPRTV